MSSNSANNFSKLDSYDIKNNGSIQLSSERILLRNVGFEDLDSMLILAGDYRVAEMLNGSIPYPYSINTANEWITKHLSDSSSSSSISWAIIEKEKRRLIGSIQIRFSEDRSKARLSYWIGYPYWNQGYATEAGKCVVQFCFEGLKLKEIQAEHYQRNPASGSVLKKLGFIFTKTEVKAEKLNNNVEKFDEYIINNNEFF